MAPLSKEEMFFSRERFQQQLVVAFGGRVAEKRLTGTISSGASNDLKQATDMAKQMVFDLGMGGEEFVAWGSDQGPVFLGGEISRRKDFSEETARELEGEVNKILEAAYSTTETVIGNNWVAVEGVANALLERETIEGTLIAKAYERAQGGASAEDITRMIVEDTDAAERRIAAAEQRAAEADRQRRAEQRPAPTIRPASEGPRG